MLVALGFIAAIGIFGFSFYASSEVYRLIPIYMTKFSHEFDDDEE